MSVFTKNIDKRIKGLLKARDKTTDLRLFFKIGNDIRRLRALQKMDQNGQLSS
jgi:hypothetical protein